MLHPRVVADLLSKQKVQVDVAQAVADLVADAVLADAEASHLTKDCIRKIQSRALLGFFVSNQPKQLIITKQFD
jgi:hypothetical protein